MASPLAHPDMRPLLALAEQFEHRSELLRARASMVGRAPHSAGWYSSGARAFARSVDEISAALLVVAGRMQRAAAQLRAIAAQAGRR